MIRSFIAADLPGEIRSELQAVQNRLKVRGLDVKWVLPSSMHLTVKFLGEVPNETFAEVLKTLGEPLGIAGPIKLSLASVGAFPSSRRARVLWMGLTGDIAALSRAALTVEARVERAGIVRSVRSFSPHLTLGRSRGPSGVGDVTALLAEQSPSGGGFEVTSFVVYESVLGRGGPTYTPRKSIALQ